MWPGGRSYTGEGGVEDDCCLYCLRSQVCTWWCREGRRAPMCLAAPTLSGDSQQAGKTWWWLSFLHSETLFLGRLQQGYHQGWRIKNCFSVFFSFDYNYFYENQKCADKAVRSPQPGEGGWVHWIPPGDQGWGCAQVRLILSNNNPDGHQNGSIKT